MLSISNIESLKNLYAKISGNSSDTINPHTISEAIAKSTTLDFSKIVGCSGVGRSSSGMGVYVKAENFNGDNIVCVYALGGEIASGETLYFTITGFID